MSVPVPVLAIVVVVASLLVLPFAARAFWSSAVVHREWTSTSSLIFLSGMVGGLATSLSNLIAPAAEEFDPFGNVRVALTGWAAQLNKVVIAATLAAALVFFVRRAGRARVIGGAWIAIMLVVVVALADVLNGAVGDIPPRVLALLALLLATTVAQPGRPAFLGAAAVCLTYAFLGGLQAAVHPADAFRTCRSDKCGPGGVLYIGAMSNENALGLVMALSIPFLWLALRGRGRIAVVGYIAGTVALSGSRTAQIAAAVALLALLILRPNQDGAEGVGVAPVRQLGAIVAVVVAAIVGAALPLLTRMAAWSFGDRTDIWMLALDGISESPLIGHGGTAWPGLYEIGYIPLAASYSPHNQWLDVLYASGFAGFALFVGMLAHLLLRTRHLVTSSATILIPVLAASVSERPWSFAENDGLTFTLLAALLCCTNTVERRHPNAALDPGITASRRTGAFEMSPMQSRYARVIVICQLDGYANGLKPVEVERFLSRRGHRVQIVDTSHLSRATRASRPPSLRPRRLALYLTELAAVVNRRWGWARRHLSYYLIVANSRLRAAILARSLPLDEVDLVICETPYDAAVLAGNWAARTLYDCPTPWADELYFEERLTERQHGRLRRIETELFEKADYLAFHWQTYADYAVRHYGITGRNLITLNFGCTPSPTRAQFAKHPRIVYLGSLSKGARFIDLPLLSRLTKLYPHIDVYGGPPPDPALGLNYLGYADPDVLLSYQAGLITCTRDELRRDGFSAKHLQYLAHGLPVLVPEWRRHLDLLHGSVPYSEADFRTVVAALSDESTWQRLSDEAYAEAERRNWDLSLAPLDDLLKELTSGALDPRQPSP